MSRGPPAPRGPLTLTRSRDVELTDNLCQTTVQLGIILRTERREESSDKTTVIGKLSVNKNTLQFEGEYDIASDDVGLLSRSNGKVSKLTHHLKSYYVTLEEVLATPCKQNLNSSNFIKVCREHSLMVFISASLSTKSLKC